MNDDALKALIAKAQARYDAMTPEQQAEMWKAQRRSWVKGNLMLENPTLTEEEADARVRRAEVPRPASQPTLGDLAYQVEVNPPSRDMDGVIEAALSTLQSYPRHYTSSLRVALSLTDWCVAHLSEIGADGMPLCVLTNGTREAKGMVLASPTSGESALARAVVAAALRARTL